MAHKGKGAGKKESSDDANDANKTEDSDNEEEEIEIDFSKVKKFFSGIFSSEEEGKKEEKSQEKKKESAKNEEESEEEEISINVESIKKETKVFLNAASRNRVIILILLAMIVSVYLRMQPAYLPITDQWAKSSVYNYYQNQITSKINTQFPNLPDANKKRLVNANLQKLLSSQKDLINRQIKYTSRQFKKGLKNDKGNTYLLAIDPYFWWRHSRNILDHGHPGDILVDGRPFNTHMMAPLGRFVPPDMLHAYVEAWFYRIVRIFKPGSTLFGTVFYLPVLLMAFAVIPTFFIARKVGGDFGGFIAALLLSVNASLIGRTAGGFADTDAYNILLPLMVTWLFIEALETRKFKNKAILVSLAAFTTGLFAFAWSGWWYILDFLLGASALYFGYEILRMIMKKKPIAGIIKNREIKMLVFVVLAYYILSVLFVALIMGSSPNFYSPIKGPLNFIFLKRVGVTTIWPNVYTTVAEQNSLPLSRVISAMDGNIMFLLAFLGVALTLVMKRNGRIDIKYFTILTIWFLSTVYASTKGVRFLILLSPAYAIGFGLFAGILYYKLGRWLDEEFNMGALLSKITVVVIVLIFLIQPVKGGYNAALHEIPSMNDGWWNTLRMINNDSKENAIINSWWDFGHWFKAIADRAVTFDGTSQDTPQAHWIGKVLLTSNETEAVGILRMLDCGANSAEKTLKEELGKGNELRAINIISTIVGMNSKDAEAYLKERGVKNIKGVMRYTHCNPPEDFFIASEDMIGKSGVWAHFGNWNFTRAEMYNRVLHKPKDEGIRILKEDFGLSDADADSYYYDIQSQDPNQWIASWPSYKSGINVCSEKGTELNCGGIKISLNDMGVKMATPQGELEPRSIAYANKSGFFVKDFKGNTAPFSVILFKTRGRYAVVLSDPKLAGSMFTRQFYYAGHGLRYFRPFTHQRSMFGNDIYVYKVNWTGDKPYISANYENVALDNMKVDVYYIGYLKNGTVFDSSIVNWRLKNVTKDTPLTAKLSQKPLTFTVGSRQMIRGFSEGVRGMKEGETKEIVVPPEMGYGNVKGHPFQNTTLYFKVKMVKILPG